MISFSSCFAGGVFIAACLLDLLPDVEENFDKVLQEIKDQYKVDLDYPVAQFVVVLGFFIILLIEQTVLHYQVMKMNMMMKMMLTVMSRSSGWLRPRESLFCPRVGGPVLDLITVHTGTIKTLC